MAYYDITDTVALGCQYNLIFGERSNGKTTAGLLKIVEDYANGLGTGVYLRQMDIDLKGQRGANVMTSLMYGGPTKGENLISKASGGLFDQVKYYSRAWYLGQTQDGGEVKWDKNPFCYAMALSNAQHDKSATPPRVRNVVFDEFIPLSGGYLVDETVLFRQTLSTIIRDVDTVQVFLFANAISWQSHYYGLFGVTKKVRAMQPGETVVVTLSEPDSPVQMKLALEYCASSGGKKSDVYFDFADETSAMITNGKFAVPEYPKCPHHFTRENIRATFWVLTHTDEVIRCRLMKVGRDVFVFADTVTQETYERFKDERRDLFYSLEFSSKRNHYVSMLQRQPDDRTDYIVDSLMSNRIFFASNEVGEDLMYYIKVAAERSVMSL